MTGTRLQATGFTTPTPVTVQSAATIQERAKVNIADALNEIPSFQPTQGPAQAQRNASSTQGSNTIDLRGLGSGRTLVLLDGRRFVPVSPGGAPDVSDIPTNLLDRVEVVTGGASAQYGSDAVAGVVNFILNDRLEGIKANAQYGFSQHGDNLEPALNLAIGHTFADGKIHVIAGADWSKNTGITSQYDRDWGKLEPALVGAPTNRPAGMPALLLTDYGQSSNMAPGGIITSGPLKGTVFGQGGTTSQFQYGSLVGPTQMIGSATGPNYGLAQIELERPTSRLSTLARVNFDVTPDTTVYVEGSYAQSRINSQNGSLGTTSVGDIPVLASNPYLPAAVAAQVAATGSTISVGGVPTPGFTLGRLSFDLGRWGALVTNRVYRGVVGVRGKLGFGDWKYDAYFQYGETDQDNDFFPVNTARFLQAAYAVKDPSGAIVCGPTSTNPYFLAQSAAQQATMNTNLAIGAGGSCVPLNPFGPNNNAAAQAYIRQNYDQDVVTKQLVGSASLSGTAFSTWAGPVSLAFGGEWRRDSSNQNGDAAATAGGYLEYNGTPLVGSSGVFEGFAETGIPLLKDSPLGKSLDFNAAIRRTHYEFSGWVTTYKIGGVYDPTGWLRIRATESRDIKAPTISNLFSVGGGARYPITNQAGVVGSVQGVTGGNPNLLPERANTFTGGFVLTPKWGLLNGLRVSMDYYNIVVDGVIAALTPPQVLQRYYAGQTSYAQYITFDNSLLGISRITGTQANLNQLKTDGVDLAVDYRVPLDELHVPGRLNVTALVTWVDELATFSSLNGITTKANRVGGTTYGDQGGPVPRYRSTVTFNYNLNKFGATLQARMFSGFIFGTQYYGPGQVGYNPALSNSINDNSAPGEIYWSLQLRYNMIQSDRQTLQFYATADNLFDKDPPLLAIPMAGGGGIPYDLIGRTFRIGARLTL